MGKLTKAELRAITQLSKPFNQGGIKHDMHLCNR